MLLTSHSELSDRKECYIRRVIDGGRSSDKGSHPNIELFGVYRGRKLFVLPRDAPQARDAHLARVA